MTACGGSRSGWWSRDAGVAAFHGAQSARAEDNYDEATVIVKLALEGEIKLQRAISEDWTRPLGESGAAHWGVGYLSTSHKPEEESLRETVVRGFLKSDPVQLPIAIPLDERSEAALRDVFGGEASELDAETGRADADGV